MNTNENSAKISAHLKWIQTISALLKILFLVVAIIYTFYALSLIGGFIMQKNDATPGQVIGNNLDFICDTSRQLARVMLVLFCYKLFELCSRGELFASKIVLCIRRVGCAYFLIALSIFPQALRAMKDDSKMIIPHFISSLFVSFLFLFTAWILNVSLKIKQEPEVTA